MANTFKNEVKDLTTSNADILAASEVTGTGIVLTIRCTNVDGTNDATVDVEVVKASSGGNAYGQECLTLCFSKHFDCKVPYIESAVGGI